MTASRQTAPAGVQKDKPGAPDMATCPWLIVVLAQQRSGTTAFGRTLNLGDKIHSLGEVFHNVRMSSKVNYFNFREEVIKAEPQMAFTTHEHQGMLWNRYLEALRQRTAKPFVMIDAKYNSWHHFNGVWYNTGEAPAMVKLVKTGRAKVIHIIRRDLFAQACSAIIAERTRQFHFTKAPEEQPARQVIDPRSVLVRMQRSSAQTELFRQFFSGYRHYCELIYEDMFSDNHLSRAIQDRVSGLLGEDCHGGSEVPLSKATPPLSEIISNSQEVLEFFQQTPFGEMVHDVLDGTVSRCEVTARR